MITIFVLKLKNNKYFVGTTKEENFKLEEHFKPTDFEWTQKYAPICIQEIIKSSDFSDINKYVFEYMAEYGIINVRGGDYSHIKINEFGKSKIHKMLNHDQKNCYICGNKNHTSNNCDKFLDWELGNDIGDDNDTNDINGTNDINDDINEQPKNKTQNANFIDTEYDIINTKKSKNINKNINLENIKDDEIICYRCGRKGHLVDACYATTHFCGETLDRCYRCGRDEHCKIECRQNTDIYGRKIDNSSYYTSFLSIAKEKCFSIKNTIMKSLGSS
jgi:hypothetical protein